MILTPCPYDPITMGCRPVCHGVRPQSRNKTNSYGLGMCGAFVTIPAVTMPFVTMSLVTMPLVTNTYTPKAVAYHEPTVIMGHITVCTLVIYCKCCS